MKSAAAVRLAIEALPVHSIGGYEWECDECHYHMAEWLDQKIVPRTCETCGATVADPRDDGSHDAQGRLCGHGNLLDRAAVLGLFEEATG